MNIQVESQYPFHVHKAESQLLGQRVVIDGQTVYAITRHWEVPCCQVYAQLQGYLDCLFAVLNPPRREIEYTSREVSKFDYGTHGDLFTILKEQVEWE